MKFFFAQSNDVVDPSFDFQSETRSEWRMRHTDDKYPHELFDDDPYDGVLLSWANLGLFDSSKRHYTLAQRHQLRRIGLRSFLRITQPNIETMGDCGAFAYVKRDRPPVTIDEIFGFYIDCDVDYGISVDHLILGYNDKLDNSFESMGMVPDDWLIRQQLTIELATDFMSEWNRVKPRFIPIGVAQGWSPRSYAKSVEQLQKIGYDRIALGGMVPLRTNAVINCLEAIANIRNSSTQLHLLGLNRIAYTDVFSQLGVTSFDSASPMRRAFLDDRYNYQMEDKEYIAIRVPQSEANPAVLKKITAGEVSQSELRDAELNCLNKLRLYDQDKIDIDEALIGIHDYGTFHGLSETKFQYYKETLEERPWNNCDCTVCKQLGIEVVLFRGAERNKRRGFHNLWITKRKLDQMQIKSTT